MCTLSFAPTKSGYIVAMNRDERIARADALSPEVIPLQAVQTIFPREPGGGTWIGVNEHGLALMLLNKNADNNVVQAHPQPSRGEIIPALLHSDSIRRVEHLLAEHLLRDRALATYKPFRLIAIAANERAVLEWSWNQALLDAKAYDWSARHWYSSSASDELAGKFRSTVFNQRPESTDPTIEELRELHASHQNGPGAFSVCAHRPEVRTVSYTEIIHNQESTTMNYRAGSPCQPGVTAWSRLVAGAGFEPATFGL